MSWADAYDDLHNALAVAKNGDEIWIAQGVYKPDRGTKDRAMSFSLVDGIEIYGGFAGWETQRDQRDGRKNETILSGDLEDNDGPMDCAEHSDCCVGRPGEPGCDDPLCQSLICELERECCIEQPTLGWQPFCARYAEEFCCHLGNWRTCENSFVVLKASGLSTSTVLDGVTVAGAYASFPLDPNALSAAVLAENSVLTVSNCHFRTSVIGVFGDFHSEVFAHSCIFSENQTGTYAFGELRGCTIINNELGAYGSRLAADCVFSENRSVSLHVHPSSEVRNCVFLENDGGGISASSGSLRVEACLFLRNGAGGLFASGTGATVRNSVFLQNSRSRGGAMTGLLASITLINCLLAENSSFAGAGAMNFNSSRLFLRDCTVVQNRGGAGAGGISVYNEDSRVTLNDTILVGNTLSYDAGQGNQISLWSGGTATINHSIVEDWDGTLTGVGTFDADPHFAPGPAGDYYLSQLAAGQAADSPAVDAGSDATADPDVFARTTRSDEGTDASPVDIGFHYPVTGRPFRLGDCDRDGVVDLFDFSGFQNCVGADSNSPAGAEGGPDCGWSTAAIMALVQDRAPLAAKLYEEATRRQLPDAPRKMARAVARVRTVFAPGSFESGNESSEPWPRATDEAPRQETGAAQAREARDAPPRCRIFDFNGDVRVGPPDTAAFVQALEP